jgi:hypothetical protein
MAQQDKDDLYNENPKDTTLTGSNKAHGDGTISDEDVNAIDADNDDGKPIGQDHSTENRENQVPTSGVGAIQNSSDTASDIAHLEGGE